MAKKSVTSNKTNEIMGDLAQGIENLRNVHLASDQAQSATRAEPAADSERLEAITEWCNDIEWEQRNGSLPIDVRARLANVDRALYASNRIAEMLLRDQRGKADARHNEGVVYPGISALEAEALSLAMIELNNRAEDLLSEVRENQHGCCGTGFDGRSCS